MRNLTREEVRNVIEGKGAAFRVPLAYDIWIGNNIFGGSEEKREKWLAQYPRDIATFGLMLPDRSSAAVPWGSMRRFGVLFLTDPLK